jgi:hypothetical protein
MHADLSDTVLHSIAKLAAIGLERARGEEATARAEAARHSSELRATVLDALAHEFKTPLTSMKAAGGWPALARSRSRGLPKIPYPNAQSTPIRSRYGGFEVASEASIAAPIREA